MTTNPPIALYLYRSVLGRHRRAHYVHARKHTCSRHDVVTVCFDTSLLTTVRSVLIFSARRSSVPQLCNGTRVRLQATCLLEPVRADMSARQALFPGGDGHESSQLPVYVSLVARGRIHTGPTNTKNMH